MYRVHEGMYTNIPGGKDSRWCASLEVPPTGPAATAKRRYPGPGGGHRGAKRQPEPESELESCQWFQVNSESESDLLAAW